MSHSSIHKTMAAPDQKKIFRLTEMEVEEVSLVDRAANQRKFLVVKRAEDQMNVGAKEVHPNGKGGMTTQKAGAGACGAAGDGKKKKPGMMKALEVPPGFKEAAGPLLDKVVERVGALQSEIKGSKPAEIGEEGDLPGVPAEFASGCQQVMGLLDKLCSMWPTAAAEPEESEEPAEGEGDTTPPAPSEMQMRLAEKAFVDASALLKRVGVEKIGAKMSKDRYARLAQAAEVVMNLVAELAPATTPAPGAPPLGKKAAKEEKKEDKDKAEKSDAKLDQVMNSVAQLAGSLNQLAGVVAKQQTQVARLAKSRGEASNLAAGGESGAEVEGSDVSWPLDMNRPISRDNVEKADSFFSDSDE